MGKVYSPFLDSEAGKAYMNFEVAELLKFWTDRSLRFTRRKGKGQAHIPSWCPNTHASLFEEVTERVRLSPAKDEDLRNLKAVHKLILPHQKKPEEKTSKLDK